MLSELKLAFPDKLHFKVCIICGNELFDEKEIQNDFHNDCKKSLDQSEVDYTNAIYSTFGRHVEECCPLKPSFPILKTSFEDYTSLEKKFLSFYRQSLITIQNATDSSHPEVIQNLSNSVPHPLKPELSRLKWIIYETDVKTPLELSHIDKICEILQLDFTANDLFNAEKIGLIQQDYPGLEPFQLLSNIDGLFLLPQHSLLQFKVHLIFADQPFSTRIFFCSEPIDHLTAELLFQYYKTVISVKERYLNTQSETFCHYYSVDNFKDLFNNTYVKQQKEFIGS